METEYDYPEIEQRSAAHGAQNIEGGSVAAQANNYGVPTAFLWANTLISCLALCMAIVGLIVFGIFYRELEREVRVHGEKVTDMRASMIARDINPNNHDIQDAGGKKP